MESGEAELDYNRGLIRYDTSQKSAQARTDGCVIFRYTLEREIDRAQSHLIYLLQCREKLFGGATDKSRQLNDEFFRSCASQTEMLGGDIDAITDRICLYQERLKFQQDRIVESAKRVKELELEIKRLDNGSSERMGEFAEALMNEQTKCNQLEADLQRAQEVCKFQSSQIIEQSQLLDAYIEDVRNLETRLSLIRG